MTSRPRWRAEAANSLPIQPAPTTTTRPPASQALAQRVAVGERAQVVDPVELGARDRDPPRLGARGQQQPVEPELAPSASVTRDRAGSIAVTVASVSSSI